MAIRERILVMGPPGTGKSYQLLKIAKHCLELGLKTKFHCIDTDDALEFMIVNQFPELHKKAGGNMIIYPAYAWPEYKAALKTILEAHTEHDWIALDMADNAWRCVQNHFVNEVFGEEKGDYFLAVRKAVKARGDKDSKGKDIKSILPEAFEGWVDWPVINSLYDDWILPIVYRTKCHVYATTKIERIGDRDPPETKIQFGSLGVRPAGQKHLGHQVHTVLLLTFDVSEGKWYVTTAKDRGNRGYFKKTVLTDLYMQYFVAKANWPMEEGE